MSVKLVLCLSALLAVAAATHSSGNHNVCEAKCGSKEEIIVADDDADAKIWGDECLDCYKEHCAANPDNIHCTTHQGCSAEWDACRSSEGGAPSWASPTCCSWSKCVCTPELTGACEQTAGLCTRFADCDEE